MELWTAWKTWPKENSRVSGGRRVVGDNLRGKEDKEEESRHFVNLERAVWVHRWVQKATVTRCQHCQTLHFPGGLVREAKILMRQNPWKITPKCWILPVQRFWLLMVSFSQGWQWGREPQLFPPSRSPAQPGTVGTGTPQNRCVWPYCKLEISQMIPKLQLR